MNEETSFEVNFERNIAHLGMKFDSTAGSFSSNVVLIRVATNGD